MKTINELRVLIHKLYEKRNKMMHLVGSPSYKSLIADIKRIEKEISNFNQENNNG